MTDFQVKSARQSITSVKEARIFLRELIALVGLSFHPDTPASDYISMETHKPIFSEIEAIYIDARVDNLKRIYGDEEIMYEDIEKVGSELFPKEYKLIHGK